MPIAHNHLGLWHSQCRSAAYSASTSMRKCIFLASLWAKGKLFTLTPRQIGHPSHLQTLADPSKHGLLVGWILLVQQFYSRGMEHVIRLQPLNKLTFKRAKGLLSTKHTPTKDRSSQGGRWSLLRSNFSPVSWHPTPLAPEYQASFLNRHTSVLTNRNEQVPPTFYTTMSDRISVHSD